MSGELQGDRNTTLPSACLAYQQKEKLEYSSVIHLFKKLGQAIPH